MEVNKIKKVPVQRTKTGCISCRYAKKKCDETKPKCALCTRKNIPCVWPHNNEQTLTQFINQQGQGNDFADTCVRKSNRSKNGCSQCRKRKKKCDEQKPICQRCLAYGDECSFLFKTSTSNTPSKLNTPTPSTNTIFPKKDDTSPEKNKISPTTSDPSLPINPDKPLPSGLVPVLSSSATSTLQSVIPQQDNALVTIEIPSPLINIEVPFSVEIANSQIRLVDVFFDEILKKLVTQDSYELLSGVVFGLMTNNQCVKDSIISLAASFVHNIDITNKLVVKHLNFSNEANIEAKLHAIIFTTLISLYAKTSKENVLSHINYAISLVMKHIPVKPNKALLIIIESIIYHYSVSIITSPNTIAIENPFFVLENLRFLYPEYPDNSSNPILGQSLDVFVLLGKVSYVFKFPYLLQDRYSELMDQVDTMLVAQPRDIIAEGTYIPIDLLIFIDLLALKALLFYMNGMQSTEGFKSTISEMIFIMEHKAKETNERIDIFGLWGVFMLGLNLTRKDDQVFLTGCIHASSEHTKNRGYLTALEKLHIAWEKTIGFDILKDQEFISDLILS